jgi:DNA invertase Pin-like site-specific DNA recombinase
MLYSDNVARRAVCIAQGKEFEIMLAHNTNAILYCRKSTEEGSEESIQNQETILTKYAKDNSFNIVTIYRDPCNTGTDFDRPGIQAALSDLQNGKANCLIVKDFSRFCREHIMGDMYREIKFPSMGIRFIAIHDNYDGANLTHTSNSMAQIKGLFNEWYAADISEKIKHVMRSKAEQGHYLSRPPYGYIQSLEDKHKLLPDPVTAPVVRRIFDLAAAGNGYKAIAYILTSDRIIIPSVYANQKRDRPKNLSPYDWAYVSIRNIIRNTAYLGHSYQLKYTKISYKVKKLVKRSENEWIKAENTHPPLVTQELWDLAQESVQHRRKVTKDKEPHIFSGLVKCADCGSSLLKNQMSLVCRQYSQYGRRVCESHRISINRLSVIVLASIQATLAEIQRDRNTFVDRLSGIGDEQRRERLQGATKERDKLSKRLEQIPNLIRKAFEQNATGKLPDDLYSEMVSNYQQERLELAAGMDELAATIEQAERDSAGLQQFLKLVDKYTHVQELDRALLNNLVDKIVIHIPEIDTETGKEKQRITIHYRFVGSI